MGESDTGLVIAATCLEQRIPCEGSYTRARGAIARAL